MPRKPWVPLPEEADLFCNIHIDESSQNLTYLVLGGIIVPHSHAAQLETDIIAAREPIISPFSTDGKPREIKWEKVNSLNVQAYKKVFDAFWRFEVKHKFCDLQDKHAQFICIVVNTSKKSLKKSGAGEFDIGFNKEIYYVAVMMFGNRFKRQLFHIYLHRRTSRHKLRDGQKIMNRGAKKYGDARIYPFRRLAWQDLGQSQVLQLVDVLLGALAFKLNGHYDKPEANKARKELCEYILKTVKISNPFVDTNPHKHRRFTIRHRDNKPHVRPSYLKGTKGRTA